MHAQQALIEAIERADRSGALAILEAWAAEHGEERLVTEVLDPVLRHIGEVWDHGRGISLAQGYVAARIAEDVLVKIAASGTRLTAAGGRGPVVIGNIEEDFQALGRRMVGTFLRADGWTVHDLGNDIPAEVFVDTAVAEGARVIGVSAMMLSTGRRVRRVREELDRRGLSGRIRLAVGGAVFNFSPEMVREVGGGGTAANALGAPALFARLWDEALGWDEAA
jgi:methanogenic corrinoid protein MtbC1